MEACTGEDDETVEEEEEEEEEEEVDMLDAVCFRRRSGAARDEGEVGMGGPPETGIVAESADSPTWESEEAEDGTREDEDEDEDEEETEDEDEDEEDEVDATPLPEGTCAGCLLLLP